MLLVEGEVEIRIGVRDLHVRLLGRNREWKGKNTRM
jgi:hypothetical protein